MTPTTPDTSNFYDYLAHKLMLVRTGNKSRAPGIRRCKDCDEPYIDDHTGLPYCPTCRTNHRRSCRDCRIPFTNTITGDRLCPSCRNQISLFEESETTP